VHQVDHRPFAQVRAVHWECRIPVRESAG
jgi:hypothetical protein